LSHVEIETAAVLPRVAVFGVEFKRTAVGCQGAVAFTLVRQYVATGKPRAGVFGVEFECAVERSQGTVVFALVI
jgi:hypothetical protein